MQKQTQKNLHIAIIAVLAFAVLFLSVGFATYSQTFNIDNATAIASSKWSVHFNEDSLQRVDGSVAAESFLINNAGTAVSFRAKLAQPGDFYAFSLNVVNDGSFDAILNSITMTELTEAEADLLKFTVSYDGKSYTSSITKLEETLRRVTGDNTRTVIVRVDYLPHGENVVLPADGVEVSLSVALGYGQE